MLSSPASRQFTRRRFLGNSAIAAGTFLGASSLLQACGSPSGSTSGNTTLTVMYGVGELPKSDIDLFHKQNPSITVKQLEYDATRLSAMFAAGAPPDFVRTTGAPQMPNLSARGLALSLDDYLAKSTVLKADDLQPVNNVNRWDGKEQGQGSLYAVVKDWSQDGMIWYNKRLFDRAGVPYPSATEPMTYDQFLALGKKLTVRQGNKIQVYGLDPAYVFGFEYPQIVQNLLQDGKSLFSNDFTQVDFTTAEAIKILQWYIDWAQARVGPSPLDPGEVGPTLFPANRLAMIQFGYWFGGSIYTDKNGLPDHVGFAPAPQWGSKRVSACFYGTSAFIPKESKNKDAAWKFMEFFAAGKPAQERVATGYGLPPIKSLISQLPQSLPYQQQAFQTQQNELKYLDILHYTPYASDTAIESAISKYIEPVMKGQGTLDQAAKQLTDAVNILLQQGKSQIG